MQEKEQAEVLSIEQPVDTPASNTMLTSVNVMEKEKNKKAI